MTAHSGWIGVDLDGTLAHYSGWKGTEIGEPVPLMLARVRAWLDEGLDVRIFTARVFDDPDGEHLFEIGLWCKKHLGRVLPVTCTKDYQMIELWDDRAVGVIPNTGKIKGAS